MDVVVFGASPEGEEVMQTPRKLVAGMRVDGLEQPEHNPEIHGQDVEVLCDGAPEEGHADGSEAEDHDFNGRGVFGGESEGR